VNLPCPFCGSPAESTMFAKDDLMSREWWWCGCENEDCNVWPMAAASSREEAEAIWNKRP